MSYGRQYNIQILLDLIRNLYPDSSLRESVVRLKKKHTKNKIELIRNKKV